MNQTLRPLTLTLPFRLGKVNCCLVQTGSGFVLIDTGASNRRRALERELENAGCRPGDLKLIVLTHGDFDHTGNAASLRRKFGARIAIHRDDAGMIERGDLLEYRGRPVLNHLIDDRAAALASFERLRGLPAHTVYTGHGPPFPGEMLRREPG